MQNITIERQNINIEALDAELRNALGALIYGISVGPGQSVVHVDESALQADIDQIEQIINDHDEKQLTAEQQTKADLAADRAFFATPLDPQTIALQELATRSRWLEEEMHWLLRGIETS